MSGLAKGSGLIVYTMLGLGVLGYTLEYPHLKGERDWGGVSAQADALRRLSRRAPACSGVHQEPAGVEQIRQAKGGVGLLHHLRTSTPRAGLGSPDPSCSGGGKQPQDTPPAFSLAIYRGRPMLYTFCTPNGLR